MTLPRASSATVALAAFWSLGVLGAAMLPMTDPDTWWHIRVGREILESGIIPRVDEWSTAGAGRTWVSQDWLSNALMAVLYRTAGPTGVSLVYGVMTVVSIAILWDAIGQRSSSIGWLARSAWLLLGLILAAPVVGARVQVVDLLLGACVLNVLWRYLVRRQGWHLVALPVIAVAWVNLHAGWPLLFLLGGAVLVGEAIDAVLRFRPNPPAAPRDIAMLVGALVLAAVALMANPNGARIYMYPFETLGIGALSSFIGEWQPARLTTPSGQLLALFIVVAVLPSLLLLRWSGRSADGIGLVGLVFMAVTAVRFLLVAGPLGSAAACLIVSPSLAGWTSGSRLARAVEGLSRTPRRTPGTLNVALAMAIVASGILVSAVRIGSTGQERAIADALPVSAVEWLQDHDVGDRIFNRYEWGGYLGLHLPDRPIFIDGRADVYGDAIIREYVGVISVNVDPGAYFERHGVDHVLYQPDSSLGAWLDASGEWRLVYDDELAGVWVRD